MAIIRLLIQASGILARLLLCRPGSYRKDNHPLVYRTLHLFFCVMAKLFSRGKLLQRDVSVKPPS